MAGLLLGEVFRGDDPDAQYEAENYRHRENKGRRAGVFANFTSTGQGVVEFEDVVAFGLTYIQKPWVSYGASIDVDSIRDQLELDENDSIPALPISMGYVTEWDMDTKGNYVGAWVAVSIFYPSGYSSEIDVPIEHFFSFDAIGLKDIPV